MDTITHSFSKKPFLRLFFILSCFYPMTSKANPFSDLISKLSSDETLIPYEIGIGAGVIFLALLLFMKLEKKKERKRQLEKMLQQRRNAPKKTIKGKTA